MRMLLTTVFAFIVLVSTAQSPANTDTLTNEQEIELIDALKQHIKAQEVFNDFKEADSLMQTMYIASLDSFIHITQVKINSLWTQQNNERVLLDVYMEKRVKERDEQSVQKYQSWIAKMKKKYLLFQDK